MQGKPAVTGSYGSGWCIHPGCNGPNRHDVTSILYTVSVAHSLAKHPQNCLHQFVLVMGPKVQASMYGRQVSKIQLSLLIQETINEKGSIEAKTTVQHRAEMGEQ